MAFTLFSMHVWLHSGFVFLKKNLCFVIFDDKSIFEKPSCEGLFFRFRTSESFNSLFRDINYIMIDWNDKPDFIDKRA
jgi:hypothetical protein